MVSPAQPADIDRYIEMLEEVTAWLVERGIRQWRPGSFRGSREYYAGSIARGEVQLATIGDALAGTLRLLRSEPIVWPDIGGDDGVYMHTLAVRRPWSGQHLGRALLDWADSRATAIGREYVRLDCMADNTFLRGYYERAGFTARGEVDAAYPEPVGMLRLRRYERRAAR